MITRVLTEKLQEAIEGEICLPDDHPAIVEKVLYYLYTGEYKSSLLKALPETRKILFPSMHDESKVSFLYVTNCDAQPMIVQGLLDIAKPRDTEHVITFHPLLGETFLMKFHREDSDDDDYFHKFKTFVATQASVQQTGLAKTTILDYVNIGMSALIITMLQI